MLGALRRGGHGAGRDPTGDEMAAVDDRVAVHGGQAGARIRHLRRARGWTQEELARATGVSRSAVAQWETGRAGFGAKLRLIATALDVSLRELQPGHRADPNTLAREGIPVSADETTLLRMFRELNRDDQDCLLRLVRRLASVVDD